MSDEVLQDQFPADPVQDELVSLKARADMMGLKYHPSISLAKLRDKVNAAATGEPDVSEDVAETPLEVAAVETPTQRRNRKYKEANELVRVHVTCMNPAKKEWEGEMFTAGNSLIGSFTKYVPFDIEEGWHVPRAVYNMMRDRQCQVFVTKKDGRGNSVRQSKLIKEFNIHVLDNLTPEELQDLAQRQAMAKTF